MRPVLFDTSIYISALRLGDQAQLMLRRVGADSPLWLSSVVLHELYAGTNTTTRKVVEKLEHDFSQANRVLLPSASDWSQAGKVIASLSRKYDYENIGRSRLTNDALIAMSAARTGIGIVTANARDFARLREFRQFKWEVRA